MGDGRPDGDAVRLRPDGDAVRIRKGASDRIVAHARRESPLECCGLLIAIAGVITEAVPARNVAARPTTFLIDPADHIAAIRTARAAGGKVAGAYHSHPRSPAMPSPSDRRAAPDTPWLHVIVSLADPGGPDLRAYWLNRNTAIELRIVEAP